MIQENIIIPNKLGLHTRAAAKLVGIASKFNSNIELIKKDQTADCKSIMAIILLGATKGMTLELSISGNDEEDARKAIVDLFNTKFGESE